MTLRPATTKPSPMRKPHHRPSWCRSEPPAPKLPAPAATPHASQVRATLCLRTRIWQAAPVAVRNRIGAALVPLERWYNDRQCARGTRMRWASVDDRVMLGAVPYAAHVGALKALGVQAVINAMDEGATPAALCRAGGLQVLHLAISNGDTPNSEQVRRALAFIDTQTRHGRGKVYIHCNMGSGRSACLAFAYLRDMQHMPPKAAQRRLQEIRPQVHRDLWLRVPSAAH